MDTLDKINAGVYACSYCGKFIPRDEMFCTGCGQKNENFDSSLEPELDKSDCENGHADLKQVIAEGSVACIEMPFCECCGFCGLPATWREHVRPPGFSDRASYELVKDNQQVAMAYFWLDKKGLLDPSRMMLVLQGISFDELYLHIEQTPNLQEDVQELLMASRGVWDVAPGETYIIPKQ